MDENAAFKAGKSFGSGLPTEQSVTPTTPETALAAGTAASEETMVPARP